MVALNAVWLAAKIEESPAPKLAQLNATLGMLCCMFLPFDMNYRSFTFHLSAEPYPIEDFITLERIMITFFKWNLLVPTAATFLDYYADQVKVNAPEEYDRNRRICGPAMHRLIVDMAYVYLDTALMGKCYDFMDF